MNIFFECGLPKTAPEHLHWTLQADFEKVSARIHERMEKLQKALELTGMKPETFQVLTSELFKREETVYGNVDHFDSMSAEQLASYAQAVFVRDEDYERLEFPNVNVLFDTAYATVKEWEFIRHVGIGGSDAAVIEGTSKFRTPLSLFHDKAGTPIQFDTNGDKRAVFERGHVMEDSVIETYCSKKGAKRIRDTRMFQSKKYPHCIADIDAILRMDNGEIWLFEAKTTVAANDEAWADNKVPPYYETQTHHYLAVLDDPGVCGVHIGCLFTYDLQVCGKYVGSQYNKSQFVSRDIPRNESVERGILEANEKFWNDYVETGIEPPRSNDDHDREVMKAITGEADTSLPAMDMTTKSNVEDVEYYMELAEQKAAKKKEEEIIDAEMKSIQSSLITQLGQTVEGRIFLDDSSYYEVRYAPSRRVKTDLELLEAMYPEAYAACVTVDKEASRRFTIKRKGIRSSKKAIAS